MTSHKNIHHYLRNHLSPLLGIGTVSIIGVGIITALQSIDLQANTIALSPISDWNTSPDGCKDSDGGYNPYKKGILTSGDIQLKDFCYEGYLYEYSCGWKEGMEGDPHNGFGKRKQKCTNSCKEGACVQQESCEVTGCKDGYKCSQGFCKEIYDACRVMDCMYGCKEGKCIEFDNEKFIDYNKKGECKAQYSSCNCGYACTVIRPGDELIDCARSCTQEDINPHMPICKFVGDYCKDISKEHDETNSTVPPAGFEDEVRVSTSPQLSTPTNNWFSDVDLETPEGRAANILADKKIIGGFKDGTFRMNQNVNRAEAAKFIVIAKFKDVSEYENKAVFWDIIDGEWYVPYVIQASKYGIIQGNPDGSFRPANPVNTAEFLSMLSRAFQLPTGLVYSYTDVPESTWFSEYAGIAQKYHLFPNRTTALEPERILTRGEVAVAIALLLEQIE